MQFSIILTTLLASASVTMAVPAMIRRTTPVCTGTYSNAQCCATDVLGVADLNCAPRKLLILLYNSSLEHLTNLGRLQL